MPRLFQCLKHISTLMESSIIHSNHTFRRELWDKVLDEPCIKHIRIDWALEESDGQELVFNNCPYGINSASGMPVLFSVATHPLEAVAVRTGHIYGKATLIKVDDWFFCFFWA